MSREPTPQQLVRQFQSEVGEIRETRVPLHARLTLQFAVALFVLLGILAASFDIDRVVTSVSGQIVTSDPTVVVQPLDASIINSIDIQEGDRVTAGQLLATLDPTFVKADVNALQQQIASLDAEIARCEAELAHADFTFAPGHEPGGPLYAGLQRAFFTQRRAQFAAQLRADDAQVSQAHAAITRLEADQAGYAQRLALTREIEQMRQELNAHQVESRLVLLQASDASAEIRRNMDMDANMRIEAGHQLDNATGTRDAFVQQWDAQTSQELVTASTQRDAAQQQLDKASRHQDLVRLTAPDDAVVLRLARLSVGSVLQPGDSFIELAKLTSKMEAEIYVDPRDIGFIRPGDEAVVKLDPYNFVEHGWATGKVRWISEGTFTAPPTGTGGTMDATGTSPGGATPSVTSAQSVLTAPYYKARITITRIDLKKVPETFRLVPGMTLNADIHVGTRSLFAYLVRDIVRVFDESMREP